MKKSLFDKNYRYKKETNNLVDKVSKVLEPIFNEYIDKGFSPREIEYIISETSHDLCLTKILDIKLNTKT